MGVSVRLDWHGEQVAAKVHDAIAAGLDEAAKALLGNANQEVPLDHGDLQKSGDTDTDSDKLQATVFYDTPYAAVQHENEDYEHDPGRKYHYLKDPADRMKAKLPGYIADKVRQALK